MTRTLLVQIDNLMLDFPPTHPSELYVESCASANHTWRQQVTQLINAPAIHHVKSLHIRAQQPQRL